MQQQTTCTCPCYSFPHRRGSGECGKHDYCEHGIDRSNERCYACDPPARGWRQDAETGEWLPRG